MKTKMEYRRNFLKTCGFGTASLLVRRSLGYSKNNERPNIIVLLADDLGYGELSCQGNPQIQTPHIDSIAKNGIRFTDGYVTASVCSPSRAGLHTGRYQVRFGYESNIIGAENENPDKGLPKTEQTLADMLRDAGYTTSLVGKWHQGGTAAYHPLRRGFDEFFGFLHEGHFYVPPPWHGVKTMLRRRKSPLNENEDNSNRPVIYREFRNNEPPYDANNPILRNSQPVLEKEYLTDAFTREAVDFIGRHKHSPFFLFLSYNAIHSPLQGADKYMKQFSHIKDIQRRIFAAMLANLDDSVGAVLKKLKDEELEKNTVVFFLSDNGGPTEELTSSNLPLRGGKGQLYEGGIRVPFMVQWKDTLPAGIIYTRPVISLDIFATAAALAGTLDKVKNELDGVNLIPFLKKNTTAQPHEVLFWRMNKKRAVRVKDWKLTKQSKRNKKAEWELYDLAKDISEARDLARSNPEKVEELRKIWETKNSEISE